MIGGQDIVMRIGAPSQLEGAVRLITSRWDQAVIEDAETGAAVDWRSLSVRPLPPELLIYRNTQARESWATEGSAPGNCNSMIHVLRQANEVTFVVDDRHASEMVSLLTSLQRFLGQDLFWMRSRAA